MKVILGLQVVGGRNAGKLYKVSPPGGLIGRNPICAVYIAENKVSSGHAEFQFLNGVWAIRDLSSRNGSFLNGKRLGPHFIELPQDGKLRFADVEVRYFFETEQADVAPEGVDDLMSPPTLVTNVQDVFGDGDGPTGELHPKKRGPTQLGPDPGPSRRGSSDVDDSAVGFSPQVKQMINYAKGVDLNDVFAGEEAQDQAPAKTEWLDIPEDFAQQQGKRQVDYKPPPPEKRPRTGSHEVKSRLDHKEDTGVQRRLEAMHRELETLNRTYSESLKQNQQLRQQQSSLQQELEKARHVQAHAQREIAGLSRALEEARAAAGQMRQGHGGIPPENVDAVRGVLENGVGMTSKVGEKLAGLTQAMGPNAPQELKALLREVAISLADLRSMLQYGRNQL